MSSKQWAAVAMMAVSAAGIWKLIGHYGADTRLSRDSTVHDFKSASATARTAWLAAMCDNGACLGANDWKCGFSFTSASPERFSEATVREQLFADQKRVRDCFMELTAKAQADERLGKLGLLCGRRHMIFIGDRDYKKADCDTVGGSWGVKSPIFEDEAKYFK